jgi:glycine cleavage system H protein
VNRSLKEKPEAVNSDPHGSWMIAIRLTNPGEVGSLLNASQYAELLK